MASVLAKMEDQFVYQGNGNGGPVEKSVPFFYSISNASGRYLRKHYLRDPESEEGMISDMASMPTPRGVLVSNGVNIDNSARTNPHVRGNYRKMVDGNIEMVSSELSYIPLILPLNMEIVTSNAMQLMEIFETASKTQHASIPFGYYTKGIQVRGLIVYPDNLNMQMPTEWSYDNDRTLKHEMELEVRSSLVRFDGPTTRHLRNKLNEFDVEIDAKINPRNLDSDDDVHGPDSPFSK